MTFTVRDLQDLLALLEQHPEWKSALRASLLGEEFLQLPALVRELAEAQKRTQEELRALAEAQRQMQEELRALAEAQRRMQEELRALAEAQRRTEERVGRLEEAMAQLADAQRRTEQTVQTLVREVGTLKGESVERRYREYAHAYFQRILKRIRPVPPLELQELLDEAVAAGRITEDEQEDVLLADVIVAGCREGRKTYLVAEVSEQVRMHDVKQAARRADVLRRATGDPVVGAVAGKCRTAEAEAEARARSVWMVLDGVVFEP